MSTRPRARSREEKLLGHGSQQALTVLLNGGVCAVSQAEPAASTPLQPSLAPTEKHSAFSKAWPTLISMLKTRLNQPTAVLPNPSTLTLDIATTQINNSY